MKDGPLTPELDRVVSDWKLKLGQKLTVVLLERNMGLAAALNVGLRYCKNELVARMDTDDISVPVRFEKQMDFMQKNPDVAVSSGLIEEWSQDYSYKVSERRLPLVHEDILRFAKFRSPMSHAAVMYRKSAVLAVGGYPRIYPEDYPLWGAMLVKGYVFANLPDLLLKVRVGDAINERRGVEFLKGEIEIFKYLHAIGFINRFEVFLNCLARGAVRLSPTFLKKVFYKYSR